MKFCAKMDRIHCRRVAGLIIQHFLFKLILELFGMSFFLSVTINLSLVNLFDVFHSFQTIVDSEGLGVFTMLASEEEGVN